MHFFIYLFFNVDEWTQVLIAASLYISGSNIYNTFTGLISQKNTKLESKWLICEALRNIPLRKNIFWILIEVYRNWHVRSSFENKTSKLFFSNFFFERIVFFSSVLGHKTHDHIIRFSTHTFIAGFSLRFTFDV